MKSRQNKYQTKNAQSQLDKKHVLDTDEDC